PECGYSQVAVWIDQHHRAMLAARVHQVVYQAQQQARLATTRLGHGQQVPAKQPGWQMDWNGVSLVGGNANATAGAIRARGHGAPQWQPATSGGSLHEDDVVASLRKMPQAGQLADVEQTRSTKRHQPPRVGNGVNRACDQPIASRQRKRPIRGCQPIESRLHAGWIGEGWSNDADSELDLAGVATQFGLDEPWVDERASSEPPLGEGAGDRGTKCSDHQPEGSQPVAAR